METEITLVLDYYRTLSGRYFISWDCESVISPEGRIMPIDPEVLTETDGEVYDLTPNQRELVLREQARQEAVEAGDFASVQERDEIWGFIDDINDRHGPRLP